MGLSPTVEPASVRLVLLARRFFLPTLTSVGAHGNARCLIAQLSCTENVRFCGNLRWAVEGLVMDNWGGLKVASMPTLFWPLN
jgi:hypothetical protein